MSLEIIGVIGVVALLVFMAAKIWIGFAMAIAGFLGIAWIRGFDTAFGTVGTAPFLFIFKYSFTVMPMFILMGNIISESGIGADLYYTTHRWLGQMRGGLAMATTGACALFAAITGSSMTGVLVMAKVALPEMKKFNYDDRLSTGTIAAGSTMGSLIPPSMMFILYGILTEQSVGKLFMAGIIPGILEALFYMTVIFLICRINPSMGPRGPKSTFKEKVYSLKNTWAMLVLFLLVMGGIYGGIFTPTEAGAVGAFGAIIITLVMRRLNGKGAAKFSRDTVVMTAMFVFILMGSSIFMRFIALSQLPFVLGDVVAGLEVPNIVIVIAIMIMYIVIGCFMPAVLAIILTIPIVYPMIIALGFDPIWFGVLIVRMTEISAITPPVGMECFVLSGVSGIPLGTIFRGVVPFIIADFCHVALLIAIPALSLLIPNMMA